jgi:hypothetical protein
VLQDVRISASQALKLDLHVSAGEYGQTGAEGGSGGNSGYQRTIEAGRIVDTYGTGGRGGDAGSSGAARAMVDDLRITGSAFADDVTILVEVDAGYAAQYAIGGGALLGSDDSITLDLPGFGTRVLDHLATGGDYGLFGREGKAEIALLSLTDVAIRLGDDDDRLAFGLSITAEEMGHLVVSNVLLSGGEGWDILSLEKLGYTVGVSDGGVTVDLRRGLLTLQNGAAIRISGFEEIVGTNSDDRFIDRNGSTQVYHLDSIGRDRVMFARGNGADVVDIRDEFQVSTRWELSFRNYGTAMDSLEELTAATTAVEGGIRIALNARDSVTVLGATLADLSAETIFFG